MVFERAWSHYADGHEGVVIEVEVPDNHKDLIQVIYTPFSPVFTDKLQTKENMRHLFNGKGEEWAYEQEYRIVIEGRFFDLPKPVERLLLGPLVSEDKAAILRKVVPRTVEIVRMKLDQAQGALTVNSPDRAIQPTPAPQRFTEAADS